MYCIQETYSEYKDTYSLKVKRWKKIFPVNSNQESRMATQISDKTDSKSKTVLKDQEGHYILIKREIHQEDITNIKIYIYSQNKSPKTYEGNTDRTEGRTRYGATVIVGDFNSLHSIWMEQID